MSELPPGWEWTTLGDIAESVKNGIYISRPGAIPDGVPILRINAVRPAELRLDQIRYSGKGIKNLQSEGALLEPGDLLFTRYSGSRDYVGVCAITPDNVGLLTYPDKLIRVRLKEVEPRYVMFAFSSPPVRAVVESSLRTTAGQVGISGANLKAVRIPLAPLAEQRRIVAVLEDHLSAIDEGLTSLQVARRKTSFFAAAELDEAFRTLAYGRVVHLREILREPLRNGYSGRATTNGRGVRVITLTAVTKNQFIEKNVKLCETGGRDVSDLWLERGDILIQRANTPELVGTAALYSGNSNWSIFPDLLIRIRANDEILPEFLNAVLSTKRMREHFRASAKGLAGTMPKIDQSAVENATLCLPSLDTQREVVDKISEIGRVAMKLNADMKLAECKADRLRASLLTEGFAGRLVPQDPDDEPASVLLKRIKTDRVAQPKPKQARRNTDPDQERML